MKQLLITILLCISFFIQVLSQTCTKNCHLGHYETNPALFYAWRNEMNHGINIPNLTQTTDSISFRYWGSGYVVDIHSFNGKKFKGNIICYIYNYIPVDSALNYHLKHDTFYVSVPIKVKNIKCILEKVNFIRNFAPQDSFPNWSMCTSPLKQFEIADSRTYFFKEYDCPQFNTEVPEARALHLFIEAIDSLATPKKAWNKLRKTLPPGEYTTDAYRPEFLKQ